MPDSDLKKAAGRFFLRGRIEGFREKSAIIKIEDGQEIGWPIKELPEDAKAGQEVRLILSTEASESRERKQIAKTILNELLQADDEQEG